MKNFRITEQTANIGWKETDFKGKPSSRIVQYENIVDLLNGEGFYDEHYDEDEGETPTSRMELAIKEEGGFMCDDYDNTKYWHDPEPCDSYLTYGNYVTIEEVTQAEIDAENLKESTKKLKEKNVNDKKWNDLFHEIYDVEILKKELLKLKFPKKL